MVANTAQHQTSIKQVVPVSGPIDRSFAAQAAALADFLTRNFRWPSPDAGFALFVFHEAGLESPLRSGPEVGPVDLLVSSQAPELAAAGYLATCQLAAANAVTHENWAGAFLRLSGRAPFPADRHAFTYRPVELLGIALGVQRTPSLPEEARRWLVVDVLNTAPKKCVTDAWSSYFVSMARIAMKLSDGQKEIGQLEALRLEELALLVWLTSSHTFRHTGAWSAVSKPDIQRHFLLRCMKEEPNPLDVGRAAVLHAAIQIAGNSLLESDVARNWQIRSATKDALELVVQICRRFHQCAQQLRHRHDNRVTLKIEDEYDVQDLMHAFLRLHFEDIRPEEWSPSYAGSSARMDFLLKRERVVVETKMTRKSLKQKEVTKQLIEDSTFYRKHPDCDALICFVYDPDGHCTNPVALEHDMSEQSEGLLVRVVVVPQGR